MKKGRTGWRRIEKTEKGWRGLWDEDVRETRALEMKSELDGLKSHENETDKKKILHMFKSLFLEQLSSFV